MASEETPLLANDGDIAAKQLLHDAVYNRFSRLQKRTIVSLIALAGLSPCKFIFAVLRCTVTSLRACSAHIRVLHPIDTTNCSRLEYHRVHSQVSVGDY